MDDDLEQLDLGGLAAAASSCVRAAKTQSCRLLRIAAVWADGHPADGVFHQRTPLAMAGERTMRFGGEGTPDVAEFAPAELGPEIGESVYQATSLLADALDLRHRFPRIWRRVMAGSVHGWQARRVAMRTRTLTVAQAEQIDVELSWVLGQLSFYRLNLKLDAAILRVDHDNMERRAKDAARQREVRLGRSTPEGLTTVYATVDTPDADLFDGMVDRMADILAGCDGNLPAGVPDRGAQTKDEWRSVAFGVLGGRPLTAARIFADHVQPDPFDGLDWGGSDDPHAPDSSHAPDPSSDADDLGGHDHHEALDGADDLGEVSDAEAASRPSAPASSGAESDPDPTTAPQNPEPVEGQETTTRETDDPSTSSGPLPPERDHGNGPSTSSGPFGPGEREQLLVELARRIDPIRLAPKAVLHVHISADAVDGSTTDTRIARVEEHGPHLLNTIKRWLNGSRVSVQQIIDPAGIPAVDRYEVPAKMAEALLARTPGSVFPWSSTLGCHLDHDHTTSYLLPSAGPPGQTGLHNLGDVNRSEHRFKTHGRIKVKQPEPGTFVWRTRFRRVIITNPAGTHDLGNGPFADAIWHAANQIPATPAGGPTVEDPILLARLSFPKLRTSRSSRYVADHSD